MSHFRPIRLPPAARRRARRDARLLRPLGWSDAPLLLLGGLLTGTALYTLPWTLALLVLLAPVAG